MALTINATFVKSLPTQEGESQRGHWVRGGAVVEYGEEYPRKVAISLFGEDKVAQAAAIPVGTPVQVKFSPESREFNDKWYTDLRGISITPLGQQAPAPYVPPQTQVAQGVTDTRGGQPVQMPTNNEEGDLPF